MKIIINHTEVEISGNPTLAEVLMHQNLAGEGVAVAIDNKVVPRALWGETPVADGAKLTVITAICGG